MRTTGVIGDIHGFPDVLRDLLRAAGLAGRDDAWTGADSTLWLVGDLVDHGHHGVEVIDLVMRLQRAAATAGGHVECLIGNHDALILAAKRFGAAPSSGEGGSFLAEWRDDGGEPRDLARLTDEQIAWLEQRPAMARVGNALLIHADALLYERYGGSVDAVNRAVAALLHRDDPARWDRFLEAFGEHHAFLDPERGETRARAFLRDFGGTRIVHGHSPISKIAGEPAAEVRGPLVYANGLCVDVDGGIYLGGPGFLYYLLEAQQESAS
jgi:hypothetical protein